MSQQSFNRGKTEENGTIRLKNSGVNATPEQYVDKGVSDGATQLNTRLLLVNELIKEFLTEIVSSTDISFWTHFAIS